MEAAPEWSHNSRFLGFRKCHNFCCYHCSRWLLEIFMNVTSKNGKRCCMLLGLNIWEILQTDGEVNKDVKHRMPKWDD